ncbi:MAG: SusD/RagB family nutrient-binding outer membrane lipoprotein [Bacteroidota bacterium]
MKTTIKKWLLKGSLVLALSSCTSDFLNINVDPNNPSTASLDFLLPAAQASAGFFWSRNIHQDASIFVQHFYALAPSQYNITGSTYGNDFNGTYNAALKDFDGIIKQGTERNFKGYVGIAKVMQGYLYMMLVDAFGDVPFSEALQGETIKSPRYDDDAEVYAGVITLLTEAKADLTAAIAANEPRLNSDLVYGTSANAATQYNRWIKAANTILLRLYLNLGNVNPSQATTGINALITENNFISSNAEDFQLVYGSTQAPLTRHPLFQQEYAGVGKGFYITNYFMYHMLLKNDPRLTYYVFRQGTDAQITADAQLRPCRNKPNCVYGWLSVDPGNKGLTPLDPALANGYIGRDMGDDSGIPGDNQVRATFGVYPIGGSYDRGPGGGARTINSGATGAGVIPFMTNFMRAFMLAEAAITLGTPGDPRALMLEGIDASFAKVETFSRANDGAAPVMATAAKDAYKALVTGRYDAANTATDRLDVIISEKYFANFGNGMETYTDYRRTGMPSNLPAPIVPLGPQPRRFPLPPAELNANANAPNPPPLVVDRIFWDNK